MINEKTLRSMAIPEDEKKVVAKKMKKVFQKNFDVNYREFLKNLNEDLVQYGDTWTLVFKVDIIKK